MPVLQTVEEVEARSEQSDTLEAEKEQRERVSGSGMEGVGIQGGMEGGEGERHGGF